MPGIFHHESLYRGNNLLTKIAATHITICGVGAVGSNLADSLARQGVTMLRAIDHDRVEEHNVSTQLYGNSDVGTWKVEALRNHLFRATGIEIEAIRKELTTHNARQLLKGSNLVIDAFDNSASRAFVQEASRGLGIACLHVGLFEDYCEVVWDEEYRVPRDAAGDICDYPLARNLVLLAVTVASESIMQMLAGERPISWSATLKDLAVRPLEPRDSKA